MPHDMHERIERLEHHVLSLDKDEPGLVIRVDRLEMYARLLIVLASLGCAFQVLEVVRAGIEALSRP